jgi:hypothetical protein
MIIFYSIKLNHGANKIQNATEDRMTRIWFLLQFSSLERA